MKLLQPCFQWRKQTLAFGGHRRGKKIAKMQNGTLNLGVRGTEPPDTGEIFKFLQISSKNSIFGIILIFDYSQNNSHFSAKFNKIHYK